MKKKRRTIEYIVKLVLFTVLVEDEYHKLIFEARADDSTSGTTVAPQTFIEEPKDVTVKERESVTLPCLVKNKVGKVRWTKDKFGLGEERNLGRLPSRGASCI